MISVRLLDQHKHLKPAGSRLLWLAGALYYPKRRQENPALLKQTPGIGTSEVARPICVPMPLYTKKGNGLGTVASTSQGVKWLSSRSLTGEERDVNFADAFEQFIVVEDRYHRHLISADEAWFRHSILKINVEQTPDYKVRYHMLSLLKAAIKRLESESIAV